MNKFSVHWFSYSLIAVWLVICIICQKIDLVSRFANRGFQIIGGEHYRFVTALFLHNNYLHVLSNATALYFVGRYLEPQINPVKLLVFSLLIGVISDALFAAIYKESVSIGGSPIVFALIGLIAAMHIMKTDYTKFQLGTWYGNWIMGYIILSNIPLFSTNFVSTLNIHVISTGLGVLLGCLSIGMKLL